MSENSSKLILAGGILGLVFLIIFGLFSSDVELEYSEPAEVESVAEGGPIIYDDDYIIEKFVSGLNLPTTMTFVGEDILVLEKNTGKVIRIQDNGVIYNKPVLDVPVEGPDESGLLGITSMSNHVFLYFAESESGFDTLKRHDQSIKNKVYRYDWDGETLTNPILIKELLGNLEGGHVHHGGAMATNLNDEVYFVIGDLTQFGIFQNIISSDNIMETSSIFKVDTENNNVELFAMGIRNSFGLAVDPVTGYLWDTENGPDKFDEINLVKPGFNSGWRLVMGPAVDSPIISQPFENFVYSDPEFSWYKMVAPTAIEFPDKDNFRKYSDWLFVGDFNNGRIYKFQLNADRTGFVFSNPGLSDLVLDANDEIAEILFAEAIPGGVTDIEFHNDAMYVVSILDGSIYKIYSKELQKKTEEAKFEMLKLLKTRTGIEYVNLSNSDFRGTNFDTAKISNVNFTRANLSHVNLSGKDLTTTILTEASLSNANLTGVNLSGKDLTGTILTEANLSNANLTGVDLSGMDFTRTILTEANLSNANLTGVDLSGRDLTETILRGSNLSNANLTGVDLSGRDLTGAILVGIDLSNTDLSNAILINVNLENATLENAKLLDTNLDSANLTNTDLRFVLLVDANLSNAILTGADLTNAVLTGAILTESDLENAVLTNAILNCVGHPICIE
jgi:uncharacterized protein YjbI with pentapeptide repeats/glucose/arabinose dehydrogenase